MDKNLSFDQFSHDLTLALLEEETLRVGSTGSRWGLRRRTRSTGNLRKIKKSKNKFKENLTKIFFSMSTSTNGR